MRRQFQPLNGQERQEIEARSGGEVRGGLKIMWQASSDNDCGLSLAISVQGQRKHQMEG